MNYQTCSVCRTTGEQIQLEYNFVFPDADNGTANNPNITNKESAGDFQEKQPCENLIKGMNYIENSCSKNGKDLNRSAPKHENPNEFVDNSQNFLEETKEPLEGIIGKQDDETKSNEVINHFHFVHSAGDIRMRDKTIAELGMSKRKDVVLKSLLRKI